MPQNEKDPPVAKAASVLAWDERIFELLPSGVDRTLIAENLRLSPTERLEKLTSLLRFIEEAAGQRSDSIR